MARAAHRVQCWSSAQGAFVALAEIEMRATIGGADQCTGGTVIFSSQFSTVAEAAVNAFDNNINTKWANTSNQYPAYIGYVKSMVVREWALTSRNDAAFNQSPTRIDFQASDTPTDELSWETLFSATPTGWIQGETRIFSDPTNTDTEIGVSALVGEALLGFGSDRRIAISEIVPEALLGFGTDRGIAVADIVAEHLIGPPVVEQWIAAIVAELVILPGKRAVNGPVQIIGG